VTPRRVRLILLAAFFLSGVSALIYQILWMRMFGLVFGISVFAVSTVLTTFMAGLALGSWLFGRWIDRWGRPLAVFAGLEIGIGLLALAFPLLFRGLAHVYVSIHQQAPTGFYATSLIRFVLSFLLLLVPTTLMGGTLPVLSKFFVTRLGRLGWDIGHLYSANNLGAVAGVCLAGFFLIQTVGMTATLYVAATLNVLVGLAVLGLRARLTRAYAADGEPDRPAPARTKRTPSSEQTPQAYPPSVVRLVLWAFAIEGFTTLSYEVIWTRILVGLSPDKTVYLYSTIVVAFILGLSVGSFAAARLIDRARNLLAWFACVQLAIGLMGIALLPAFTALPAAVRRIYASASLSWWSVAGVEHLLYLSVMLLPAAAMGTTFPIVGKLYTRNLSRLGSRIGNIGCLDTVGSIFGAFAAGFILIPFTGVRNAAVLTAMVNLLLGGGLLLVHPDLNFGAKLSAGVLASCVAVFGWFGVTPGKQFRYSAAQVPGTREIYYREGTGATVSVRESADGSRAMLINGAYTAFSSYPDMRVHQLLAYLPAFLQGRPRNALVIGLGMGVTARCLIRAGVGQVDCVEICPAVLEAADRCFRQINHDVLRDPRFRVIVDDGRSYLMITDRKYDLITSNAVHARMSPNLYTSDFYQLCKSRLSPEGVMCQWLPTNWMSDAEYRMLVKSFMQAFPHTSLWFVNAGHTLLIGTPGKVSVDFRSFAEWFGRTALLDDLAHGNLDDPAAFLAHYIADEDRLGPYVSAVPLNSDDHPYVEFSRVVSRKVAWAVIQGLLEAREEVGGILKQAPEGMPADLGAALRRFRASSDRAVLCDLFTSYQMEVEAVRQGYAALKSNPADRHARATLATARQNCVLHGLYLAGQAKRSLALDLGATFLTALARVMGVPAEARSLADVPPEETVNVLREKTLAAPDLATGHHYLGVVYSESGGLERAVEELRKAVSLDPRSAEARLHLGLAYARLGKLGEAVEQFRQVQRLLPWFDFASYAIQRLRAGEPVSFLPRSVSTHRGGKKSPALTGQGSRFWRPLRARERIGLSFRFRRERSRSVRLISSQQAELVCQSAPDPG